MWGCAVPCGGSQACVPRGFIYIFIGIGMR